ncbi:hypothetical protein D3C76_990510 [compost metagenome]
MPTPRAITGKVATLTPMPMATISASHSTEVSISGRIATRVARQLRKVIRQNSVTARYTSNSMRWLASRTTTLVAASIPALPAASRNCRSSLLLAWAKRSATAATCSRVSAR